jgi:hypothetical protein
MVIFGLGYGVESLKNIEWLKTKEIYYWGDIDTHGFAILSQIRGYFPQVESILMDEEVTEKYRYLGVEEPKAKQFLGELDNLSLEEEKVFERLKLDDSLNCLRIEQERVPLSYLNRVFEKLGTGALAPIFCEAKAVTSDEFCKKSNNKI